MNSFSNDRTQFMSKSLDYYKQESPSSSSSSVSTTEHHSDEEVILASSRPNKTAGRRIFKETRHPIFRGVRRRNGDKWVCEVREPNKKSRIWLGTYPCPEMAARAHDVAALALRGKSACLNFADSAWRLPLPDSSDAEDIRRAAREAAEMFRPQDFGGKVGRERSNIEEGSSEVCSSIGDFRVNGNESVEYFDEDDVFQMPSLMAEMAQGLLLQSPTFQMENSDWDDKDNNSDFSLWRF